jgi:hypothetical protein
MGEEDMPGFAALAPTSVNGEARMFWHLLLRAGARNSALQIGPKGR